jgi:threonine/homoserine/homoserine lactone efflux protein
VVAVLFTLGGALGVIYLLWCGIQYITAGGNQDKVKTARQGIINAVLGIIIMMTAWFIIRLAVSAGLFAATATDAVKKP